MAMIGTACFPSFTKACDYYRQGEILAAPAKLNRIVQQKIDEGEIFIKKPDLNPGERLLLIDGGTRYGIKF